MPLPRFALCAALFTAACVPATGAGFVASNGMVVERTPEGLISVPWRGLSGATYFWCAAGDYVIRELGMAPATRIWRVSPPPRRQGEGILFSLSPEGAAGKTGMAVFPDDGSLTAAFAQEQCEVERLRPRPID